MKKESKILKILSLILVHLVEFAIVYLFTSWVLNNGPEGYKWPIAIVFAGGYLIYFVLSLVDDYKTYQGADFYV